MHTMLPFDTRMLCLVVLLCLPPCLLFFLSQHRLDPSVLISPSFCAPSFFSWSLST
ncbi:hypothetical protein BDV98DRAFT_572850 [Pterulicium gracile]|uniref:Uncharacterized protein n=1 Tax=Pterulicium gracile TaxID=1884261 RepID=A0A5C3QDN6_9AGAR|nr:hypothetical protein BDV98DRAFT_572850 [Pterula gracilis]